MLNYSELNRDAISEHHFVPIRQIQNTSEHFGAAVTRQRAEDPNPLADFHGVYVDAFTLQCIDRVTLDLPKRFNAIFIHSHDFDYYMGVTPSHVLHSAFNLTYAREVIERG